MIRVKVTGADDTARRLDRAAADLAALDDTLRSEAQTLAAAARLEAPRDTGALAAAAEAYKDSAGWAVRLGRVAYGPPVHRGSRRRNRPADPYLFRAREAVDDRIVDSVRRKVREITNRTN